MAREIRRQWREAAKGNWWHRKMACWTAMAKKAISRKMAWRRVAAKK